MKFEEGAQNLKVRLRIIQVIVLVLLSVLGVRLYFLQVVHGAYYAERAENQRVRLLPIPAQRGTIFDRKGKVLVDSRPSYNVILSREATKGKDLNAIVAPLAEALNLDLEILRDRFEAIKTQPAFESIIIKQEARPADIAWIVAHNVEHPELRIEQQPQRRYPDDGALAHVLGYVSEIGPKQLERLNKEGVSYKPGDLIGQEGLERVYDSYLRGRDGYRRVIVDSRGQIQDEIEKIEPQSGQDLVTTIDLDLQLAAEEQLRATPTKRGVIVLLDPNNGEVLAMASAPSFDPNLFSQRITTKEGRAEYAALLRDPERPLYNRAIRGRYPPGSTWKIPMAMAGLLQGAITLDKSTFVCGGGIQIGNKFTRCMSNHGAPDVRAAIQRSCNGYFYRLGLKMGLDGLMQMTETFDLNKRTGIDLPQELASWTPSREFKARFNPTSPEWKDIDTVYSSIGQVYDVVTPLAILRAVAGISVGGKIHVPHLLKEAKAVGAPGSPDYRPARFFDRLDPKVVEIPAAQHRAVMEGSWAVVNAGGSGARIKMEGFDIAGKTGTAQVASLGKDTGKNEDHAWFVSFAPAYKPEIAAVALIENVGFGGTHAAPAIRRIYDVYYRNTRGEDPPGTQVAQSKVQSPKPKVN